MDTPRRLMSVFAPPAIAVAALSGLAYLVGQQIDRHEANDPQIALAHDAADRLAAGEAPASVVAGHVVDIAHSPSPFLVVIDSVGRVLASSGTLDGEAPRLPNGALDVARTRGENRVSWQPRPSVRVATIQVAVPGKDAWVVVAGRSLEETEDRIAALGDIVLAAFGTTMILLLLSVIALDLLDRRRVAIG